LSESPVPREKRRNTAILATDNVLTNVLNTNVKDKVRCKLCNQKQTEDVIIPSNADSECIVLTKEVLANIYTDELDVITHNLTNYSIYDENGHLCSIDSGIMERNVPLYLTGYVKPIDNHDPSIEDGFAAMGLGPILEWWLSSYDGGSRVIIGISTDYADYLLIEPHTIYKKYMISVTEKIHLSRLIIKSMLISKDDDPTYEDVLNCIINSVNPATGNKFTEEDLIAHAQFVLDQVTDYDLNDTHYLPLAETQCIETLTELSGAAKKVPNNTLNRARQRTRSVKTDISKPEFSKATTTELVKDVFENMFAAQLDIDDKENDVTMNKLVNNVFDDVCKTKIKKKPTNLNDVEQVLRDLKLSKKMFVLVKNNFSPVPLIGRIEYLFKTNLKNKAHVILFKHSYETVLGEASDSQEIFALKKCMTIDVTNVIKVLDVKQKIPSNNWFNLGNSKLQNLLEPVNRDCKNSFFYQLQYDDELGRFEYPKLDDPCSDKKDNYCSICEINILIKKY